MFIALYANLPREQEVNAKTLRLRPNAAPSDPLRRRPAGSDSSLRDQSQTTDRALAVSFRAPRHRHALANRPEWREIVIMA
jgi:hypothetical protein